MNYKVPQISFKDAKGKPMIVNGMNTYTNQVISSNSMRSILIHGDIEWVTECHISNEGTTAKFFYHTKHIKKLMHKNNGIF